MPNYSPSEMSAAQPVELSVVMPCLNEADTVGSCVEKAIRAIRESGIAAEVIVADNGSTDGSQGIAEGLGARVVKVTERGYGNALMGGIAAARGSLVVMGDADDSYDFMELPRFIGPLRKGNDLVQGCRFSVAGGEIMHGAMPPLHRWLGNPMFSWMMQRMFGAPVHDVYCGMRGFRRDYYATLDMRCTGMEFAVEMILKASLRKARIAEVPITLHPDGRRAHAPHLRTFRDGWRTLRFLLMSSPRWLFLQPGLLLLAAGAVCWAIALPGLRVGGIAFDAHTLLFGSLALLVGYQGISFALFAKTFAVREGLLPPDPSHDRVLAMLSLERGLLLGVLALGVGAVLLLGAIDQWRRAGFGALDYSHTMRWVVPGVTLTALGFQTVLGSFLTSILKMPRRRGDGTETV